MSPTILLTCSLVAAVVMPPARAPIAPPPPRVTCLDATVRYDARTSSIDAAVGWACPLAPHAVATLRVDGVVLDARLLPQRSYVILHGKADPRSLPARACVSLEPGPLAQPAAIPAQCGDVGVAAPRGGRLPGGIQDADPRR